MKNDIENEKLKQAFALADKKYLEQIEYADESEAYFSEKYEKNMEKLIKSKACKSAPANFSLAKKICAAAAAVVIIAGAAISIPILKNKLSSPGGTHVDNPNVVESGYILRHFEPVSTKTTPKEQYENTFGNGYIVGGYESPYSYFGYSFYGSIDTGSTIIFMNTITSGSYFDKNDGKIKPLCQDLYCDHENFDCIKRQLQAAEFSFDIDGRIYYSRYTNNSEVLYSCLEDGTDIRKECNFTDIIGEPYSSVSSNIICDNTCLYFSVRHTDEDGYLSEQCYRYNVITKKIDNLTKMAGEKFDIDFPYIYLQDVFNDNIYFMLYECEYGEPTKVNTRFEHGKFVYDLRYDPKQTYIDCYVASFNFDDVAVISGEELYNASVMFTVKTPDSVILEKYTGNKNSALISIDNDTFEVKTLAEYPSDWTVIYIMDNCFYYIIEGSADMAGYTVDIQMPYTTLKMENPIGGRVYKYDFTTKKSTCVLNNPKYFNFRLIYLDGEKFAAMTDMVIEGTTNRTYYFLFGEIDENGKFVNINEVLSQNYTHCSSTISGHVFFVD